MWYVIYSRDVKNSLPLRRSVRPRHLARCEELVSQGRLLVAGPRPAVDAEDPGEAGFQGSLIIADFESLEAAKAWAEADPYVEAGVYESVEVTPFRQVLP